METSLAKTKNQTFGQIATLFGGSDITEETWDELETLLIQSDMGSDVTKEIIISVRERITVYWCDKNRRISGNPRERTGFPINYKARIYPNHQTFRYFDRRSKWVRENH